MPWAFGHLRLGFSSLGIRVIIPKSTFYFIVPVYNETANIGNLLKSLRIISIDSEKGYHIKVIIVDDGSRDGTSDRARQSANGLDIVILKHEQNQGPGRAFGTGFSYLASVMKEDDLVVTMEGDNTSRIELLKQMLHRLEEGYDVVLASPYLYGGGIENTNSWRVFLSGMANLFVKELLGIHGLFTVSSFFRLYRTSFLRKLQMRYGPEIIERNGFECMTELIMKMVYMNAKISEVDMVLDAKARIGKSKMKIFKTINGYFSLWFMAREWRSLSRGVEIETGDQQNGILES